MISDLHYLELILLAWVLIYPALDLVLERFKSSDKKVEYIKTVILLWLPTVLLVYLFQSELLSVKSLNHVITLNWRNILSGLVIFAGIIYVILLVRTINTNEAIRADAVKKLQPHISFMPETKSEVLVFTLLLSVTAGICEELIFRAWLFTLIDSRLGTIAGIVISSVLFGFWHLYLGWREVVKTSIMGALFCGVYLFTGNIVVPIILHIFVDVYSGVLSYYSLRKTPGA